MTCDVCGFKNDSALKLCRSCGATLPEPPTEAEIAAALTRLSEKTDAAFPSAADKIMKQVCFALTPIAFMICFIFAGHIIAAVFSAALFVAAGVLAGYPKVMWMLEKFRIGIVSYGGDDLEPNDWWAFCRRLSYWTTAVVAAGVTIYFCVIGNP